MKSGNSKVLGTIFLGLLVVFSAQAQNKKSKRELMSEQQKTQEFESFRDNYQAISTMENSGDRRWDIVGNLAKKEAEKHKGKISSQESERLVSRYGDGLSKTLSEDKYLVSLVYNNEDDYPILYGGSSQFQENESPDFYKLQSENIFYSYLGENYEIFEPRLSAVTTIIVIDVKITTPEQFNELLKDTRIVAVNHLGNPPPSDIIYIDD